MRRAIAWTDAHPSRCGAGKSTKACEIAARMSRGQLASLPGADHEAPDRPRGAVILSTEEDEVAVIRPRLELAGADMARIAVWTGAPAEGGADPLPPLARQGDRRVENRWRASVANYTGTTLYFRGHATCAPDVQRAGAQEGVGRPGGVAGVGSLRLRIRMPCDRMR